MLLFCFEEFSISNKGWSCKRSIILFSEKYYRDSDTILLHLASRVLDLREERESSGYEKFAAILQGFSNRRIEDSNGHKG